MTLADLKATTPLDRWRSLPVASQEAIGATVLEWIFAELVAEDDGTQTTEADRSEARDISDAVFNEIAGAVESAFPAVEWSYPPGVFYEVHDSHGQPIGRIDVETGGYRFNPHSPRRKPGKPAKGMPFDAVPPWARRVVENGGWWGAVLPDAPHVATAA